MEDRHVKSIAARATFAVWVFAATAALAQLWLARPDLGPQFPPAFSLWLVERYGSTNGEELCDLETLLALACAFLLVVLLTLSVLLLLRRRRPAH
ncbi:hypothetical protein [Massilia sp. BKSP1R2A-1]|uniref:hypothetical protein n=1 Tax=Massilia sp. BKSP1R2A-1 TaxID=3422595 RepID=UPI003D351956